MPSLFSADGHTQGLYMLRKHYTNWVTLPAARLTNLKCINKTVDIVNDLHNCVCVCVEMYHKLRIKLAFLSSGELYIS